MVRVGGGGGNQSESTRLRSVNSLGMSWSGAKRGGCADPCSGGPIRIVGLPISGKPAEGDGNAPKQITCERNWTCCSISGSGA